MKVPPHLISLYVRTARRYKKLVSKIQRKTASSYQQKTFLHELRKLARKLQELKLQLRVAAATGTVILLMNTTPAQAQESIGPFVKQSRLTNPLREPLFTGDRPIMKFIDFDGDGDFDAVVGEYDWYSGGYLRYFQNQTAQGSPLFLELEDEENPFDGIRGTSRNVAPAFADIDEDGDIDLFLGQTYGPAYNQTSSYGIEYYRNDGGTFSKQTGLWDDVTKEGNPFDTVQLGDAVHPVFIDFDHDQDLDVVIGSYQYGSPPDYVEKFVHYFENEGDGVFSKDSIFAFNSDPTYWSNGSINPAITDLDGDGDYDLLIGNYYDGDLRFYKQTTPGNFVEETTDWDPVAKTGNPFNNFYVGVNASPTFLDFDGDGDLDLFLSDDEDSYKYSDHIINYYENSGNNVFTQVEGLENPFSGVYVEEHAAPVLMDIDGDDDLDAVIGNKYDGNYYDYELMMWVTVRSFLTVYDHTDNGFEKIAKDESPYNGLEIYSDFSPQFADVDGDGDLDIISANFEGDVVFFKNNDGEYTEEVETSPFAGISLPYYGFARLADIDNDSDLDLFVSNNNGEILFFKNTGTAQAPDYVEQLDADNPFDVAFGFSSYSAFVNFTDIDHDGDLDLVYNGISAYYEGETINYFENTGSAEVPVFENDPLPDLFPDIDVNTKLEFTDYDGDGDLDVFAGKDDGTVSYMENQNKAVKTAFPSVIALYARGGDAVVVDPKVTLTDPDNDLIVQATVSIDNFQTGETLSFTPDDDIAGSFNTETGVLTFRGKASLAEYQALLRTVTFEIIDAGSGRKKPIKKSTYQKGIRFAVYDIDFTNPVVIPKALDVLVNTPPEIQPEPVSSSPGMVKKINLIDITFDVDGNLDPNSFTVVQAPTSGAIATIEVVSSTVVNLRLNYAGITFEGTDHLTIRACDDLAACAESVLSVDINVVGEVVVYNAVAPNSSGDNAFMRIFGLAEGNTVSIFNRWGDKVYDATNYENSAGGNAFKGLNSNGKPLPSGTYFYSIDIPGEKSVNGYLTLKQ